MIDDSMVHTATATAARLDEPTTRIAELLERLRDADARAAEDPESAHQSQAALMSLALAGVDVDGLELAELRDDWAAQRAAR